MQFLNPIWFTALAALSIPVVIHLWNIRPGKTLKIGSISIFEESSPANSRSFNLMDVLLLILRCLLLAMVALFLTAPFWQRNASASTKGWMLIPQAYFSETYRQYHAQIDSLNKNGYEFHYFEAGFPKEKLDEALKNNVAASPPVNDSANYWVLAALLDQSAPANVKLEVFAPNTATHFKGNQAVVNHDFKWRTFTPADSIKIWLPNAWMRENGGIRVAQGTAKPSGISYQFTDIRNGDDNPLFNVKTDNGYVSVHLKTTDSVQVAVGNQPAIWAIYAGNNEADANYLRAGLEAASRFALQPVQVKVYHQPEQIPAGADWLFWLSDAPLQVKNAKHALYYAAGKPSANSSWLANDDGERPQLFRSVIINKTDEQPVWTDGSGHIILAKKRSDNAELYSLYTRFNPTWTDLVWNEAFPSWLLQLTTPESSVAAKNDARVIDQLQIESRSVTERSLLAGSQANNTNPANYIWYLLAILFFAERWLTHKTQLSNG